MFVAKETGEIINSINDTQIGTIAVEYLLPIFFKYTKTIRGASMTYSGILKKTELKGKLSTLFNISCKLSEKDWLSDGR